MDIKTYAKEHHVPIMMDEGLAFLLEYVKTNNVKNILELGTAIGYSAMNMAKIAEDIHVDTIEINEVMYNEAIKNIKEADLDKQIDVYLMDALAFETDKQYDLIFVDAAKGKYRRYLEHFKKNSKVFIFDNLEFHGIVDDPSMTHNRNTKALVKKIRIFRDEILNDPEYTCEYHKNIGDGVLLLKVN